MTGLPRIMRQAIFDGAGGPEVIRIVEAPLPSPGPGQVLIKIAFAGVNRPDCQQRAGAYPPPPGATNVPGLEIAGRVVAVASGVTWPKVGDEICALVISGGYAEYGTADAVLCHPIPKGLSLAEAAAIPENYYTVYDNVFTRGRLKAGESFLVHGGSSGIGSTAIQLAKQAGAIVFATAGSDEKCDFCHALGADIAINYKTEDFVETVRVETNGRGVDLILDMVAGSYIPRNIASLALEGRLVQIAFLKAAEVTLDFRPIMARRLTYTGSTLRPRTVVQKAAIAEALREHVWPLLDSGTVKPVIHATFPLGQAREAHVLMESSAHLGKIMLETGK